MNLLCTKCVDTLLSKGEDASNAPEAEVMVPFTQAMQTPQGTVLLGATIMVCLKCRADDIKPGANGSRLLRA